MRFGRMGRAVVTAVMAATTLGSGTIAVGAPPKADDDAAYYSAVARRIEHVRRAGGSGGAVDRMLAREFGWQKVAGGEDAADDGAPGDPIALGTPTASDVSLPTPSIYRNTQLGRYEVLARWQWNRCGSAYCWAVNYGGTKGNDGGPDGFGVVSNIALNAVTTSFVTYTERGALYRYTNPDVIDDYGSGFSEQDRRYYGRDYSWDHGLIMYGFNIRTCVGMRGTQWTFRSRMSHTWGDTGVSSITLGAGFVSFAFTNAGSTNKWQGYSPTVLRWFPCG